MKKNLILLLIVITVILASCGKAPQDDLALTQTFEAALQTAVMETIQAELVAAETNAVPEATDTPAVEQPTTEPTPTFTQAAPTSVPTLSAAQPTDDPEPENTPQTPCYRADLISETILDGTVFTPGKVFTKIWVIRNTGVCEWTKKFTWRFIEGEDFGVKHELRLQNTVAPGEDLEIKLEMKTPLLEGNYKGTFQILTEEGGSVTPLGFWVYVISQK